MNEASPPPSENSGGGWSGASIFRGIMLRQNRRFADAEPIFSSAIEQDPEDGFAYFQAAINYIEWGDRHKLALRHIDRALAIDPNNASFLAAKAIVVGNLGKPAEANRLAEQALAIEPTQINALNARTGSFAARSKWRDMESSARRTLEFDPTCEVAANFLAISLRRQGRREESDAVTSDLLSKTPDDAWAQSNAGWSALEAGNYRQANNQFLNALRLDPSSESAREGLLHTLHMGIPIYRFYMKLQTLYSRLDMKWGLALNFVFFFLIIRLNHLLHALFGHLGTELSMLILIVVALGFSCCREFGNLFLLLHPVGRHALTSEEKWWAYGIGAGFLWMLVFSFRFHIWVGMILLPAIALCFIVSVLNLSRSLEL